MYPSRSSLILSLVLVLSIPLIAQVSHGGEPISLNDPAYNIGVPLIELNSPDVAELLQEDVLRDASRELLRDAVVLPVNVDLESSGVWFDLENGDRLWRLDVKATGALSLEAFFDVFHLPTGSRVFIISEDGGEYVGGFTELNNRMSNKIAMEMVRGDMIRLELFEPVEVFSESELSLLDVGYRYRDVIGFNDPEASALADCQVPIGCAEGQIWTEVSKSILRIRARVNGNLFWATGTLVDNTAHDCRPLILTSMRSSLMNGFQSTALDFAFYRFYFSSHSVQCAPSFDFDQSMSGCTYVGDSNDNGGQSGSDYLLLELDNAIPTTYPFFYAGWSASDAIPSSTVSIHHPFGASRMISTSSIEPTISGWGDFQTHWRVSWTATVNGHGFMDLGSTGGPLLNPSAQIVGTYTGGDGTCEGTSPPDFFGRFSFHWTDNPNPPLEKLKTILDPIESGIEELPGTASPCAIIDGLDDRSLDLLSIYPNPTNGTIHLLSDRADIKLRAMTIYDSAGAERKQWNTLDNGAYSLDALEPGLYFVRLLVDDGRIHIERVIILD